MESQWYICYNVIVTSYLCRQTDKKDEGCTTTRCQCKGTNPARPYAGRIKFRKPLTSQKERLRTPFPNNLWHGIQTIMSVSHFRLDLLGFWIFSLSCLLHPPCLLQRSPSALFQTIKRRNPVSHLRG